jgi:hypothetical protein
MGRTGAVFADRFHARSLATPTEVRRALVYVLGNARKHLRSVGGRPSGDWMDPYSSAAWFNGWAASGPPLYGPAPVAPPATWLLGEGYLRAGGRLRVEEAPASSIRTRPWRGPEKASRQVLFAVGASNRSVL